MYAQVEKPKENKSRAIANSATQKKNEGKEGFGFVDNRPEVIHQRKLKEVVNNNMQDKQAIQLYAKMADSHSALQAPVSHMPSMCSNGVAQRVLFHDTTSPFTAAEATAWNDLEAVANSLGVGQDVIQKVNTDIYDPTTGTTIANSTPTLRQHIHDAIIARQIDRTDADNLGWGEFHPLLAQMAAQYGTLTGPTRTGGHAANIYTYTANNRPHQIAEETDAHGRQQRNLNTRREQMRRVIDDFNAEVVAHAGQFL